MCAVPTKLNLIANELTIGSWITIGDPSVAEIRAKAGFNWLVANIQHNTAEQHESNDAPTNRF